jgi:hypothetical protein
MYECQPKNWLSYVAPGYKGNGRLCLERRARDAGYEGDDAKVLLAASLNQTTLVRLDTYVTASFPGTRAGTETIMERLARIPYSAMLAFLK